MKKAIIVVLLCVNVTLLGWILGRAMPQAQAQVVRGGSNYLLATGQIEQDYEAVYVLDMSTRRLAAWKFDRSAKKLMPFRGRDLTKDFRR